MSEAAGSVRDEQRTRTRERIRWAVLELLETGSPATISVPAVAERAGVSLRTVYRYFPTKADLIDSISHWYDDRARAFTGHEPVDARTSSDFLKVLWRDFAANLPGVRAQHRSAAGREIREVRLRDWRRNIGTTLKDRLAPLPPRRRDEIIDVVIAASSSSMFLELVDRMGHDPDRAAELASQTMEAVIDAALREHEETT